jgi:hypothetical protein
MAEAVKGRRRYDSPRRRAQAAATRREILEAAERLFEERGYAAATIAAIAAEANVALKTVYVDSERQLRLAARHSREVKVRVGALFEVIRGAALVDPDIAELWARIQREFHAHQRTIVESLAEKNSLQEGLSVDRGADILWTLNHPSLWQLLVGERGWTPEEHEEWWSEIACVQLLKPAERQKRSSAD